MKEKKMYRVAVTEALRKVVLVEAADEAAAHQRVTDAWHNGEIILETEDFHGVEFYVLGEDDGDGSEKLERIDAKDSVLPGAEEVDGDG